MVRGARAAAQRAAHEGKPCISMILQQSSRSAPHGSGRQYLGQWVLADWDSEVLQFLQPPPAPCEQLFSQAHVRRVEVLLGKSPFDHDRLKSRIDDELCIDGAAPDVPLGGRQQGRRVDGSDHKPQIQIAFGDVVDLVSANIAEVALFAARHLARSSKPRGAKPPGARCRRLVREMPRRLPIADIDARAAYGRDNGPIACSKAQAPSASSAAGTTSAPGWFFPRARSTRD